MTKKQPARIAEISAIGLKSNDRALTVEPLALFLGPVGSGKTTILDAIRFAALGHVPALGRSEAATAQLMRKGAAIEVAATLNDGRSFARGLERKSRALKGSAFASWLPPKAKLGETAEAVRELFGESDVEAAQHLDLRELLNATAPERARQIEELLDASGIEPAALGVRGRALMLLRLSGMAPDIMPSDGETAARRAEARIEDIPSELRSTAVIVAAGLRELLAASGLTKAQEHANAEKLRHGAGARRRREARAELEDRLDALPLSALPAEALQRSRDTVAGLLSKYERDVERGEHAATVRAEVEKTLPALRRALTKAEGRDTGAQGRIERRNGLLESAAALEDPEAVPAPEAIPAPEVAEADVDVLKRADELEREAEAKSRKAAKLDAELVKVPEPLFAHEEVAAATQARTLLEVARLDPWRTVEAYASGIDTYAGHVEGYDHTGSGGLTDSIEGLRETAIQLRNLAKEHGGNVAELESDLAKAEKKRAAAHGAVEQRDADRKIALNINDEAVATVTAERGQLNDQAEAYRAEAFKLRDDAAHVARATNENRKAGHCSKVAERADNHRAALERRAELVAKNTRKRGERLKEAKQIDDETLAARAELSKARRAVAEAEAKLAGVDSVSVDLDAAREEAGKATKAIEELDAVLVVARKGEALAGEMRSILSEISSATAHRDAWAAAEWSCQRLREEDLAARAGGLHDRMKTFLKAAGRPEEPYLRSGRGVCEFGWKRDGAEIPVETLSSGESCLYIAALAAAVIATRRPELGVLMIEAAELGADDVAVALLRGCAAVAGELSNVFVATNSSIEAPDGWGVYTIGPVEVKA